MENKEPDKQNFENQELMEKKVAYYESFLKAWIENRMETDKQILTLSSLAIGLLMILQAKLNTVVEFVLWLSAGGIFIVAIVIVLFIFRHNSTYIGCLIREDNQSQQDAVEKSLRSLTACAFVAFILGIILTYALAIVESGFVIVKAQGG